MNMTSRVFGVLFLSFAAACSDDAEPGSPGGQAGQAAAGSSGQGGAGSSQGGAGSGGQAGSAQAGGGQAGAAGLAGSSGSSGQAGSAGSTGGAAGEAGAAGSSGTSGQGGAAAGTGGTDAGGAAGSAAGAAGSTAGAGGEAGQGGAAGTTAGTAGAAGATAGAAGAAGGAGASSGSSKGSGGLACTSTQKLDATHTTCVFSAGGSEFKLVRPADADTNPAPTRLAVYIHGDGAGAYNSSSAAKTMMPWVDAHHATFVSVRAPNKCAWWLEPSYTTCSETDTDVGNHVDTKQENAAALATVFATIRAAYDILDGAVYYYGASGGSIFLSGSFLPLHGDRYPGIFALNCGGSEPLTAFAWDTKNAALRAPTRLYFGYGAQDEAIIPGLASVPAAFSALGFTVDDHKVPNQSAHCVFDNGVQNHQYALGIWQAAPAP